MKKNIVISFTKKEIYSLVNEGYLVESNIFASALNKVRLLANRTKTGFNKLKEFIKKTYSLIKEIPKFRVVGGVLLCTISLNMINASVAKAKVPTFNSQKAAVEYVQGADGSGGLDNAYDSSQVVFSDGNTYIVLDLGEKGLKQLDDILESDSSVEVPRTPQSDAPVFSNVTYSNTLALSESIEGVWGKYKEEIKSNSDTQLVNIAAEINGEEVNFVFIPNPESVTHDGILEILKSKGLNPPPDALENIKAAIGKNTGRINGFIGHPGSVKNYGMWSFMFGKSEGVKATLLHETSHLFGIQKQIQKVNRIITKAEVAISSSKKTGQPIYVKPYINIDKVKVDKWGTYELKNVDNGISKDDIINLIADSVRYNSALNDNQKIVNAAEWVLSIGLGTGKIKVVKQGNNDLYLFMSSPSSGKLDYYLCPEETSRYEDSINHFIKDVKQNSELSSFAKELLDFYKELGVKESVKSKIKSLMSSKEDINVYKELVKFRGDLLKKFDEKINEKFNNNKKLSKEDKEIVDHFKVDVIYFIMKYYAQYLQSIDAERDSVGNPTADAQEKVMSLDKLDRFGSLIESKSYNEQMIYLQEQVYKALLSFL